MTAVSVDPHWICPSCHAFNGTAKRVHYICRVCGASKPSNGAPEAYDVSALVRVLRDLAEENVVLNERLTELQARESKYVMARQRGELPSSDAGAALDPRECEHEKKFPYLLHSDVILEWCHACGATRLGNDIGPSREWTNWAPPTRP